MKIDIVFYDVTTFHFESVQQDNLKDFGFSKNAKFNEVQVVLGMLVDCGSNKRGGKKYLKATTKADWEIDHESVENDAKWDGYYGIQTSEKDLSVEKILDAHHTLWRIEESDAQTFASYIREHWWTENKNHYVRDVVLKEDASRIRTNPGIFARLRSFALNILRFNKIGNINAALFENAINMDNLKAYQGIF